ncbi:peptidoglycan DD-metalloendopeptidase family protein [Sporosarcina sp. E16_3]|uniref:peptidoglycan DD-metalloendopeptidase family protein n=1 Tax=Sporosarcina sp. E16_3 TaxID=2789293 RepID=UPI001A9309DD|nr:peptidoglycan DD-metalloendopeptidase family protein [Sporosarcina sp. E16_3]MBO0602385.1 peptidoglycan DD-metalloendopeptidase family protein [Sporosarcina sp. E16_3]
MITILLYSFVLNTPLVFAEDITNLQGEKKSLDEKKKNIQSSIQGKETSMDSNKSKMEELLSQIQSMNHQIDDLDNEISPLESVILKAIEEIETLHNSIVGLENKTAVRDIVLRERVRAIQVNGGSVNYIDVLIGANSFSDFIDRFTSVTILLDADRNIMKQQMSDQEQLQAIREKLDQRLTAQRDNKAKLQEKRSSLDSLRAEKDRLIDDLEVAQEQLRNERNELQEEYEETHKMSLDVEKEILEEQQRIFREEQNRITSSFCQADGELDEGGFVKQFNKAGVLIGNEHLFIEIANEYNIDPVVMAAIAFQETGNGKSNAVVHYNNPGGLMDPSSNWSSLLKFDSLEDGLRSMGKTLNRLIHKEGRDTIQELGSAYAPLGAANDPLGLNEYWVPRVTKNVESFGGLTMNCEANIVDYYPNSSSTTGTWTSPATGRLSSQFGMRTHPIKGTVKQHRGLDIANSEGTPIAAAGTGVVSQAGWHSTYGNMIMITHVVSGEVYTTVYAHLSNINVIAGQNVSRGQSIGNMGSTGLSTGPHLHFEFHVGYYSVSGPSAVNPLRYVAF